MALINMYDTLVTERLSCWDCYQNLSDSSADGHKNIIQMWRKIASHTDKILAIQKRIRYQKHYKYHTNAKWISVRLPTYRQTKRYKQLDAAALIGKCRLCQRDAYRYEATDMINILCDECSTNNKMDTTNNSSNIYQNRILLYASKFGNKKFKYFMKRMRQYIDGYKPLISDDKIEMIHKMVGDNPTIFQIHDLLKRLKLKNFYNDEPYILSVILGEKLLSMDSKHIKIIKKWFILVNMTWDKIRDELNRNQSRKKLKMTINTRYQLYKYIEWLKMSNIADYTRILKFIKISSNENVHQLDQNWIYICDRIGMTSKATYQKKTVI